MAVAIPVRVQKKRHEWAVQEMRDIIRLLFKSNGIFSTSLLHYCHLRLLNMTNATSPLKIITQSTLPICSLTPSSLFFKHTTVTQNMCSLALTLNTCSKMPLSNTLSKPTKIRSMGPCDSLLNVVKLLWAYMLCQITATSKSSCGVNSAFWGVDLSADERDCSVATFMWTWRTGEMITHTVGVCSSFDAVHSSRGKNWGNRNDNLLNVIRKSEAEYCL